MPTPSVRDPASHHSGPEGDFAFQANLLASLNHAVIATDIDGNITHWNPCAESLYQWKSEEVIGRNILDVTVPEGQRDAGLQILEEVARSGTWGGEFWVRRKDGTRFPALVTDSVLRDASGAITGYVGVSLDLTPHRHVDNERQMLMEVANNSPDFVAIVGDDHRVLFVNAAGRKMVGLPATADVQATELLEYFMAEDRERIQKSILPALLRDGVWDGELRFRHFQTGEPIWICWNAFTIGGDDACGSAKLACVSRNITQRKLTEDQERHARNLQSLGVLSVGVAHDFNNLLVGILGNAMLARNIQPGGQIAELLDEIVLAGERASELTSQMMASLGRAPARTARVSLSRLALENIRLLKTAAAPGTELQVELPDDLPLVEGRSGSLQSVVMNLIRNAFEAVQDDRGGLIRVSTGVERLDRATAQTRFPDFKLSSGEYVFFEVADNGCGMTESTRTQLFQPFFTTKSEGRGLGLSSVIETVRTHRGAIEVESAVGQGSTFRVVIPTALTSAAG